MWTSVNDHFLTSNSSLTQATPAEKAGVNRLTVAEIETRRKRCSVVTLRTLADALSVKLDDLIEKGRHFGHARRGCHAAAQFQRTGRSSRARHLRS